MMKLFCRLNSLLILAFAWLATATPLFAQAAEETDQGLEGRYALGYGLVILGVILGVVNVCRPGKRKGDPKKPA
jgi:hypothetical protein